jgi:hypothetical protein
MSWGQYTTRHLRRETWTGKLEEILPQICGCRSKRSRRNMWLLTKSRNIWLTLCGVAARAESFSEIIGLKKSLGKCSVCHKRKQDTPALSPQITVCDNVESVTNMSWKYDSLLFAVNQVHLSSSDMPWLTFNQYYVILWQMVSEVTSNLFFCFCLRLIISHIIEQWKYKPLLFGFEVNQTFLYCYLRIDI